MLLSCFRRTKSFLFLGPKFEHERSSRAHHIYVQLRTSYIPCTPLPSPDIDIYTQTQQICLRFIRCVYVWVFFKCNVYFRYTADKYDIYGFFHVITCLRFFVSLSTNTVVSATCPVLDWSKSKAPVEVRTLESPRNPVDSHGAGIKRPISTVEVGLVFW